MAIAAVLSRKVGARAPEPFARPTWVAARFAKLVLHVGNLLLQACNFRFLRCNRRYFLIDVRTSDALRQSLQREKYERLRAGLDQKLRQNAKVEEL